jgi:hypothetical protein
MGQTESMPENDIRVIDGAVRASGFNPSWETFRRFAGGLGYVATSWVDLFIVVWISVLERNRKIKALNGYLKL